MSPPPDRKAPIRGPELEQLFEELCERRSFLILATPYLTFPAHAHARRGEELQLRAAAVGDGVLRAFQEPNLRLRIPWGLGMVAGETRLLGTEQQEGHRILRFAIPARLLPDERRLAPRVLPRGLCLATLSPDGERLLGGSVEDLSLGGARLFVPESLGEGIVGARPFQVSLNLERGPRFNAWVRAVHQEGPSVGVAFDPPLEGGERSALESWLLPELEEARQRWENRAALRAEAAGRVKRPVPPEGALFVGSDSALEAQIRASLGELLALRACPPVLGPLRNALERPPRQLFVHWPGGGVQARYVLKALAEALPPGTPALLVGSGKEVEAGRQLAAELKLSFLDWNPSQATFFRRLVLGLQRRAWGADPAE